MSRQHNAEEKRPNERLEPPAHQREPGPAEALVSPPSAAALLRLQRTHGNRFVQRLLSRSAVVGQEGGPVPADVQQGIDSARGGGSPLDSATRAQMEPALGADLSQVRVHTGSDADSLNQAVSARAFTTGSDIFFRQGEYAPGSSGGRSLLAHELTHVVQQGGEARSGPLTVGPVGDRHEQEADRVAQGVQRQEAEAAEEVAEDPAGAIR